MGIVWNYAIWKQGPQGSPDFDHVPSRRKRPAGLGDAIHRAAGSRFSSHWVSKAAQCGTGGDSSRGAPLAT